MTAKECMTALERGSNPEAAMHAQRFFKTGEGQYGAGDELQYKKADAQTRDDIFKLYLANVRTGRVNNWDIVDSSAEYIIGPHEQAGDRQLLFDLAHSTDLWQKRVGIMSAFCYVKQGDPVTTLQLAELLLHDPNDLIQKAVGWQLREVGKRVDRLVLTQFLDKHAATMPRTALRYAIEHLPPQQRAHYLNQQ